MDLIVICLMIRSHDDSSVCLITDELVADVCSTHPLSVSELHNVVDDLRRANLTLKLSLWERKWKPLLSCHGWFNVFRQFVWKHGVTDRICVCCHKVEVDGVTQWLTSLKILLDKNLIGPMGEAKRKLFMNSLFLFISRLLVFDSDLRMCTWHIIALQSVKWEICEYLMPLWLYLVNLFLIRCSLNVLLEKSVSELSVLQKIWMLIQARRCPFYLPPSGTYIQRSICVFALCWVSLCVWFCAWSIWQRRPTAWHACSVSVCVCVCTAAKPAFCFLSLKDPLWSERDTSATHRNTTPGQTQWQQVPGWYVQYHKFPW